MSKNTTEIYFTKKHASLTNIAFAAKILAWVALVIQISLVVARFAELRNSFLIQQGLTPEFNEPTLWAMLSNNLIYSFYFFSELLVILMKGVVYWLVLKGISFGLYMIVETNLNYKDRLEVESNEQQLT